MSNDRWMVYLLVGLIAYTVIMSFAFENEAFFAEQINSTVIIGLLIIIILKLDKKKQ
ncbi:hypothetical protein GCM10008967_30450 [Bacillus carboniphilus]|uniref:Uncharacterized protein n=1 Tax=Bacillus carboniphilus TaxID=86663 RepID=A0ABN0WHL1_9BACI